MHQLQVKLRNSRNKLCRSKLKMNKVPPNMFRCFKLRKKSRVMFWKSKDCIKSKCSVFSSFKQRTKVCMVYLECKLQEYRYGWCLFDLKCYETVYRTYSERSKQQTKVSLFFDVKVVTERKEFYYGTLSTNNQAYLALKTLKISIKKGQQRSES